MKRVLLLLTAVLLATAGCQRQQIIDSSTYNAAEWERQIQSRSLDEKEFTRLYALAMAIQFTNASVRIAGPREVFIKFSDGGELKAFLDNAWAEARLAPTNRPEICRRYIKALIVSRNAGGEKTSVPDTNRIIAVLRDELFLQQFEKLGAKGTNRVVHERLAADIHVVFAVDGENTVAFLTERNRQALDLEIPALRKLALVNLRRILPKVSVRGDGPLFMIVADGTYESSLLLSDKLWDEQASIVQGEVVVAVPTRDVLLFTGADSKEGIQRMRQAVEKISDGGSHLISKTFLVRRSGRWEKY